jgi:hypothetical protein
MERGLTIVSYLGLFQTGVNAGLEVTEITEDTLFKLFHVFDWTAKGLKAEDEGTDDVSARDVIEATPEDAGDILLRGQQEAIKVWVTVATIGACQAGRRLGGRRWTRVSRPARGGCCQEEL